MQFQIERLRERKVTLLSKRSHILDHLFLSLHLLCSVQFIFEVIFSFHSHSVFRFHIRVQMKRFFHFNCIYFVLIHFTFDWPQNLRTFQRILFHLMLFRENIIKFLHASDCILFIMLPFNNSNAFFIVSRNS